MFTVHLLRMSVHGRIDAAVKDLLQQLGNGESEVKAPVLRALLTIRLKAAAEEIVDLFKKTVVEYEVRVLRSQNEIFRQKRLLNAVLQPEVRLQRTECLPEVHLKRSPSLYQEDQHNPAPPKIKDEQEEYFTCNKEEYRQDLQDNEITNVTHVPVPVKSDDDDEAKPRSSQFDCNQNEENRNSVGEPNSATTSDPFPLLQSSVEDSCLDSSDQSNCNWAQTHDAHSGDENIKNNEAHETDNARPVKERPFPCSYCGKSFNLKGNLNGHKQDHMVERPFLCPCCEKLFKDSGLLTAHMCRTGEQPHSCLFCNKSFSGRGNLTRHMRIHTGEKPYTCLMCNGSFDVKEHLNRHIKNHNGEKPFCCSVCGKACTQKTDLKRHMRVHTGEKPFTCSFCGKCCAEKGDLTKHMRVHTGEKPFVCNICGKRCAQKGSLKVHMRVHTGEKPFVCFICGKSFIILGHLKRHTKLHAAETQIINSSDSTKTQSEVNTNNPANTP